LAMPRRCQLGAVPLGSLVIFGKDQSAAAMIPRAR
jgi:hypothetical protein